MTEIVSQSRGGTAGDDRRRLAALRRAVERAFLELNSRVWRWLPARTRGLHAVQAYGRWLHALVSRNADREMYVGTLFLRNRPALELMRRLIATRPQGSTLRLAVLGCSVGAEVYSILWTLRRSRPDLTILVDAMDISPEVLAIAQGGVYGLQTSEAVHASIFERLSDAELSEMFEWEVEQGKVKEWLREGITWRLGSAADPGLIEELGPKDLVIADNFLCHMDASNAELCLRNFAPLASPDGYLFVSGVDLDVRTKVALELGWEPVPELLEEIHHGDPLVRADWPFRWWGLEPLDQSRPHWQTRYASAFHMGSHPSRCGG
jgi:chemotaxis methyl-accepting protein methylase